MDYITLMEKINRAGGIASPESNWMDWTNLIIGFVFVALCAWLLWIYFDKKYEWDQARPEFDKKASGTFKGFWARYRGAIVLFLAVVLLILGIAFIMMGVLGFQPDSGIGY